MEKTKIKLLPSEIVILIIIGLGIVLFLYQRIPNYTYTFVKPQATSTPIIKNETVTMLAVGDIMLGRHVEELMNKNGSSYPFAFVKDLLAGSDITVANLEGPIVENHKRTPALSTSFNFDKSVAQVLKDQSIDIVSLANNHTYDLGSKGYGETVGFLNAVGIEHAGHPFAFADQYVLRKEVKNQKFIFVGFNTTNPAFNYNNAETFVAGIQRDSGDFLIVMVHGGEEYQLTSNQRQKNFYRHLIDKGVNVVIAHHPHVVQEVEVYKERAIFYSLGNFIFDQYFSTDVQEELSVHITLSKDTVQYDLMPLKSTASQPKLMTDPERSDWLLKLSKKSSGNIEEGIKKGQLILNR